MKKKYSDGGDIITSDDDNPDDQEVYRESKSTGVKVRDTPPGKKAVGRPTAPREQEDASPKTSVAKTKATTFSELRGQRATRAGEQQQRRSAERRLQNKGIDFRAGGYVKSADGCAKRGKTKAKMV